MRKTLVAMMLSALTVVSSMLIQSNYEKMVAFSNEEAYNEYGFEMYYGETLLVNPEDVTDFVIEQSGKKYEEGKLYYVRKQ